MSDQPPRAAAPIPDAGFLAFLRARLAEEVVAAKGRRHDATAEPGSTGDRGLRMLHELLWSMEHGDAPDAMSLGLLTVAYADHPDFDPAWNRWRVGSKRPASGPGRTGAGPGPDRCGFTTVCRRTRASHDVLTVGSAGSATYRGEPAARFVQQRAK